MSEIERMLVELGRSLDVDEAPPIAQRVASELRANRARTPRRRSRRWLLAVPVAAAVVAAAAVTPARTALQRLFHIHGVEVRRVEQLPAIRARGRVAIGKPTTLATAASRVRFGVAVPNDAGEPDHVYLADDPPGGQLTLIYGDPSHPRLLVTEFLASNLKPAFVKEAGPETRVEDTSVAGKRAIWLGGKTHLFGFVDRSGTTREADTRLVGNTLVWERGDGLTIRLEASVSEREAIEIAESFRTLRR